jgi:peptidoglycan/xylan/chitin deacetylase (PgdA/CDA1 family)
MSSRIPFLFTLDLHGRHDLDQKIHTCLDLLGEQGIPGTFFVVARLIDEFKLGPVLRRMVAEGHQVANHSLTHRPPENVKLDPVEVQVDYLKRAKDMLEQETGKAVTTFRAPDFRVSEKTMIALDETGHRADVSVNSQRFPPFSSDPFNTGWYYAPRLPYHPSRRNCYRRGDLSLWEIPVTSFVFPFMSRLYSYFNVAAAKGFARLMEFEARHVADKPLVYMTHPEEYYPGTDHAKSVDMSWKLLIPTKQRGFMLRLLFQERSEVALYQNALKMNEFLLSRQDFDFMTVDAFLEKIE